MVMCPKCQTYIQDGMSFCSRCGCPLTSESAASSMGVPPRPNTPPQMGQNTPYTPYGGPGGYQQPPMGYGAPRVPDYLVWAILETILCCLPLGIVAIIYANQANSAKAVGNYAEALEKANTAKNCIIWGVVGTIVLTVFYVLAVAAQS